MLEASNNLTFDQTVLVLPGPLGEVQADLTIEPGSLARIVFSDPAARRVLADTAHGLVAPRGGKVRFCGTAWVDLSEEAACVERLHIGRYYSAPAWISNLDLTENLLLRAAQHGAPLEDSRREARTLARSFGLDDLPQVRPTQSTPQELACTQLVRAFLGEPKLLILEAPEDELDEEALQAFLSTLQAALRRGAAALWLNSSKDVSVDDSMLKPTAYTLREHRLERTAHRSPWAHPSSYASPTRLRAFSYSASFS